VSRRLLLVLGATAFLGAALVALLLWPEPSAPAPRPSPVTQAASDNRVALSVTELGFEPSAVRVHAGRPVTLVVTRQTDNTCATELVVPEAGVKVALPLHVPVTVTFLPAKSGTLRYGCGMQMMVSGRLLVE
jgi:plastocyanin domain-containing protein